LNIIRYKYVSFVKVIAIHKLQDENKKGEQKKLEQKVYSSSLHYIYLESANTLSTSKDRRLRPNPVGKSPRNIPTDCSFDDLPTGNKKRIKFPL